MPLGILATLIGLFICGAVIFLLMDRQTHQKDMRTVVEAHEHEVRQYHQRIDNLSTEVARLTARHNALHSEVERLTHWVKMPLSYGIGSPTWEGPRTPRPKDEPEQ